MTGPLQPYWQRIYDELSQTYSDPVLARKYRERQARGDDLGLGWMDAPADLPRAELAARLDAGPQFRAGATQPGQAQAPTAFDYGIQPSYRTVIDGLGSGALAEDEDGNIFRRYGERMDSVEVLPVYHLDREQKRIRRYRYPGAAVVTDRLSDGTPLVQPRGVRYPGVTGKEDDVSFESLARGEHPWKSNVEFEARMGWSVPLFRFLASIKNWTHDDPDEIIMGPEYAPRPDIPAGQTAGEIGGMVGLGVTAGSLASMAGAPLWLAGAISSAAPSGLEQAGRLSTGHETPLTAAGKTLTSAAAGAAGAHLAGPILGSVAPGWARLGLHAMTEGALAAGEAGMHGGIDLAAGKQLRPGALSERMAAAGITGTALGLLGNLGELRGGPHAAVPGAPPDVPPPDAGTPMPDVGAPPIMGVPAAAPGAPPPGQSAPSLERAIEDIGWRQDQGPHGGHTPWAHAFQKDPADATAAADLVLAAEPHAPQDMRERAQMVASIYEGGSLMTAPATALRTPLFDASAASAVPQSAFRKKLIEREFGALLVGMERMHNLSPEDIGARLGGSSSQAALRRRWMRMGTERFLEAALRPPAPPDGPVVPPARPMRAKAQVQSAADAPPEPLRFLATPQQAAVDAARASSSAQNARTGIKRVQRSAGSTAIRSLRETGRAETKSVVETTRTWLESLGVRIPKNAKGKLDGGPLMLGGREVGRLSRTGEKTTVIELTPEMRLALAAAEIKAGSEDSVTLRLPAAELERPAVRAELAAAGITPDRATERGDIEIIGNVAEITLLGRSGAQAPDAAPDEVDLLSRSAFTPAEGPGAVTVGGETLQRDVSLRSGLGQSSSREAYRRLKEAFPERITYDPDTDLLEISGRPSEVAATLEGAGMNDLATQAAAYGKESDAARTLALMVQSNPAATGLAAVATAGAIDEEEEYFGISGGTLRAALLTAGVAAAAGGGALLVRRGRRSFLARGSDPLAPQHTAARRTRAPRRDTNMQAKAGQIKDPVEQAAFIERQNAKAREYDRGFLSRRMGALKPGYFTNLVQLARENPMARAVFDQHAAARRMRHGLEQQIAPARRALARLPRAARQAAVQANFIADQITTAILKNYALSPGTRASLVSYATSPEVIHRLLALPPQATEQIAIGRGAVTSPADIDGIIAGLGGGKAAAPPQAREAYTRMREIQDQVSAFDLTATAERKTEVLREHAAQQMNAWRAALRATKRMQAQHRLKRPRARTGEIADKWRREADELTATRRDLTTRLGIWERLPGQIAESARRHYLPRWALEREGDFFARLRVHTPDGAYHDVKYVGGKWETERRLQEYMQRHGITDVEAHGGYRRAGRIDHGIVTEARDKLRVMLDRLVVVKAQSLPRESDLRAEAEKWIKAHGEHPALADAAAGLQRFIDASQASMTGDFAVRAQEERRLMDLAEDLLSPSGRIIRRQDTKGYQPRHADLEKWFEAGINQQIDRGHADAAHTRMLETIGAQLKEAEPYGLNQRPYHEFISNLKTELLGTGGTPHGMPERIANASAAWLSAGVLGLSLRTAISNVSFGSVAGLAGLADTGLARGWAAAAWNRRKEIRAALAGSGIVPDISTDQIPAPPGMPRRLASALYAPTKYAELLNRGLWSYVKTADALAAGRTLEQAVADADHFVAMTQGDFARLMKSQLERDAQKFPGGKALMALTAPAMNSLLFLHHSVRRSFSGERRLRAAAAAMTALGMGWLLGGIEGAPYLSDALSVLDEKTSPEHATPEHARLEENWQAAMRRWARQRGYDARDVDMAWDIHHHGILSVLSGRNLSLHGSALDLTDPLILSQAQRLARSYEKHGADIPALLTDAFRTSMPAPYRMWRAATQLASGKALTPDGDPTGRPYTAGDAAMDLVAVPLEDVQAAHEEFKSIVPLATPAHRRAFAARALHDRGVLMPRAEQRRAAAELTAAEGQAAARLRDELLGIYNAGMPDGAQMTYAAAAKRANDKAISFLGEQADFIARITGSEFVEAGRNDNYRKARSRLLSDVRRYYRSLALAGAFGAAGYTARPRDRMPGALHEQGLNYALREMARRAAKQGTLTRADAALLLSMVR